MRVVASGSRRRRGALRGAPGLWLAATVVLAVPATLGAATDPLHLADGAHALFVDRWNAHCADAHSRAQALDPATPWCEPEAAVWRTDLQPDDRIYVRCGALGSATGACTYRVARRGGGANDLDNHSDDCMMRWESSGARDHPITLAPYRGDRVTIDGRFDLRDPDEDGKPDAAWRRCRWGGSDCDGDGSPCTGITSQDACEHTYYLDYGWSEGGGWNVPFTAARGQLWAGSTLIPSMTCTCFECAGAPSEQCAYVRGQTDMWSVKVNSCSGPSGPRGCGVAPDFTYDTTAACTRTCLAADRADFVNHETWPPTGTGALGRWLHDAAAKRIYYRDGGDADPNALAMSYADCMLGFDIDGEHDVRIEGFAFIGFVGHAITIDKGRSAGGKTNPHGIVISKIACSYDGDNDCNPIRDNTGPFCIFIKEGNGDPAAIVIEDSTFSNGIADQIHAEAAATLRRVTVRDNGGIYGAPGWNSKCANGNAAWEREDATCLLLGGEGYVVEDYTADGCYSCLHLESYPGEATATKRVTVRRATLGRCTNGILIDGRTMQDWSEGIRIERSTASGSSAAGLRIWGHVRDVVSDHNTLVGNGGPGLLVEGRAQMTCRGGAGPCRPKPSGADCPCARDADCRSGACRSHTYYPESLVVTGTVLARNNGADAEAVVCEQCASGLTLADDDLWDVAGREMHVLTIGDRTYSCAEVPSVPRDNQCRDPATWPAR